MSIKNEQNFSEMIAKCYSSATKYMKIEEENEDFGYFFGFYLQVYLFLHVE